MLKFALDGKAPSLDKEKELWEKVHSAHFKVHREHWCGKVAQADRNNFVPQVKATLMADFHNRGIVHKDVSWRNIGQYLTSDGTSRVVVFDMGSVRDLKDGEGEAWVTDACNKLNSGL